MQYNERGDYVLTIRARPLSRKMAFAVLFLLALVDLSVSLDTDLDPSGWNSYFATEPSVSIDAVDPSGWNYNRETKGSKRNNDIKIDRAQQVFAFCQSVVEQGSSETNPVIEDAISTAVKAKVAEISNKKDDYNGNLAFIRRFISILLNTADLTNKQLEEGSDIDVSGVIEIRVAPEQLKILRDFTNSQINVSMRELDSILSSSVHKKYISTFSVSELIENIFFNIRQKEIWLPVVLVFIFLFVIRLCMISNPNTRRCTSLVFLIFTASYIVEFYRMYKEVEINQKIILDKHSEIPNACDSRNQQWWSTLFKSLGFVKDEKQECMEYHKALLLDPLVEVSPSRVLSNILSDFVLNPFRKVGETIAAFSSSILVYISVVTVHITRFLESPCSVLGLKLGLRGIYLVNAVRIIRVHYIQSELPIWYGWIVWLVSSGGIFLLIVLLVVIVCGGRIQLFGLFSGVSVSSHRPPEISTPAAPAVSATPVTRSTSQPVLEAVSGMSNFVLMDADSLGALVLRAQTSVATVHSGVQELNRPPGMSVPLNENSDVNTSQQRITEKEESDMKTSTEKQIKNEDIASVVEKKSELRSVDNDHVEVCGAIEEVKSEFASSVLEETIESKSGSINIEKHPENVKKNN